MLCTGILVVKKWHLTIVSILSMLEVVVTPYH
jgi:hypothetical protein